MLWTDCDTPTIQPSEACVMAGQTFTCNATNGYPGTPNYTLYYWSGTGDSNVTSGQSYQVNGLGNFSLVCVANYSYQSCPEYWTACYANFTGMINYGQLFYFY